MTEFEFLIVIVSILYSLILVRIMNGAVDIITSGNSHWMHTCWLLTILQWVTINWWLFWQFNEVAWTYGDFALVILRPICVYYVVAVLVPQNLEGIDWARHFHDHSRQVFVGTAIVIALNNLTNIVVRDLDLLTVYNIFPAILITLMLIAASTDSRKFHGAITLATLTCFTMISIMFAGGGWLFPETG